MSEQAGPPSKQVQMVKQVSELIKDGDDAVIVGVFSSEQDTTYDLYLEACKYSFLINVALVYTVQGSHKVLQVLEFVTGIP